MIGVLVVGSGLASAHGPCDFSDVEAAASAIVDARPLLSGAAVIIGGRDGVLYEGYFGDYGPDTVVPIASATKLLSGVALMTLIDSGSLDPDAPVRNYLPQTFSFANAGLKATMTVRQMFAHTAGLPGSDPDGILSDASITLAQAVEQIACCTPLMDAPGASFAYGGFSMHIGGRVGEVVSGQDWESFFAASVALPLGLTTIDYQGFGPTLNPRIAGGARSNLRDYARVLAMLLRGGEIDGVRILSEQRVASMFEDETVGLPRRVPPPTGAADWGYGFGGWISRTGTDGSTLEFISPGAFGFTPWIDLERGIYGIVMVEGLRQILQQDIEAIKGAVEAAVDACACPADLTGDGQVNFFDLAAYLDLYNAGDPAADLAPPFGVLNFFDVAAYLGLYNQGCR
ncbi:MAG: beta-lactamase family protein [Phycisphaerales bacterium]|nr:beta-lactamase family protein [Phycisphaerales bacterium]